MKLDTRSLLAGASLAVALFLGYSFRPEPTPVAYTYRQFSTIESVVPGGLGRCYTISPPDTAELRPVIVTLAVRTAFTPVITREHGDEAKEYDLSLVRP